MKDNYVFEYLNENDFKIKERTIRKYNMLAYKKLVFDYYLKLKKQSNELFKVSIAAIILHIGYGYLGTFFYLHKKISEIKLFTLISSSVIIAFLIIVAIINFIIMMKKLNMILCQSF